MPTLNWIGKEKVLTHHLDVPYRPLSLSYTYGAAQSANKIIHGDNLLALKSLLPAYEGKIKCIYIDPPYNTGNEGWVYNDNVKDPKIQKWLGEVVGKESEDLSRHDKWLCMMYPRLKLLHKLLAEDGAIFISIDDNEQAHLKLLMDEIFGEGNFVANICHKSRHSISNDLLISQNHHHLICFAKDFTSLYKKKSSFRLPQEYKGFSNPDNDPKGPYKLTPVDGPGGAAKGNPFYSFKGVEGYWRYSENTMLELFEKGEIVVRKNSLSRKYYLTKAKSKGGKTPNTWWDDAGTATAGTKLLKAIFDGEKLFNTPKPLEFTKRVLQLGLSDRDSIILDSFAGSGTTAQAVLELNKEDGGNRQFILIEMEEYAERITAERVRRVIAGYGEGAKAVAGLGGDFGFYHLGPSIFKESNPNFLNEDLEEEELRKYIFYTETGSLKGYRERGAEAPYFMGTYEDRDYFFFYEKEESCHLTYKFLEQIELSSDQIRGVVIYADLSLIGDEFLASGNIIFKKIPRDIARI